MSRMTEQQALIAALQRGMAAQVDYDEQAASRQLTLITRALSAACSIVPEAEGRAMIALRDAIEAFNGIVSDLPLRDGVTIKYGRS